ncbi:MAG: hypothetical protein ACKOCO_12415, partial [Bacteroidota bacterium]
EVSLGDFMDLKGWKAVGNRLSDQLLGGIKEVEAAAKPEEPKQESQQASLFEAGPAPSGEDKPTTFKAGDTIEFE